VFSRPWHNEQSGGDVHYVSSCATGRITRLLLADVAGHGQEVGETAARLRDVMRRFVNHVNQSRFVQAMNDAVPAISRDSRFATSVVGTYFAPTNSLAISNAGHPPPLLYRAATESWTLIEQGGSDEAGIANVPLGVIGDSHYDEQQMELNVDDVVLFYTDGLIEATDADRRKLGRKGLLRIARALDPNKPGTLISQLIERVEAWSSSELDDDVSVLVFRPNGRSASVSIAARLRAPFLMIGRLLRSMLPGGPPMPWPEFSRRTLSVWNRPQADSGS